MTYCNLQGLPWWLSGKESACQCMRHGFDPWVRKIPWRSMATTPVLLPGKSHGQSSLVGYSPWGCKESYVTEHAHTHTHTHVISGQNIRYSCFNFHFLSDVEYFFMFGFIISMLFCLSSDIPIFQVGFLKSFFIYLCGLFDVLLSRFGTSVCSRSSSNCCFLTCVQISQEAGQVVWYSIS